MKQRKLGIFPTGSYFTRILRLPDIFLISDIFSSYLEIVFQAKYSGAGAGPGE